MHILGTTKMSSSDSDVHCILSMLVVAAASSLAAIVNENSEKFGLNFGSC
jgi:hypothetical protein